MIALALVALLAVAAEDGAVAELTPPPAVAPVVPPSADAGVRAFRESRFDEAVRLLEPAMAESPTYDGLVTLGIAQGRVGQRPAADATFRRAIDLDRQRAEAYVERGGLRFLERQYDAAIFDLAHALTLKNDRYTRSLLASSLQLAGRTDEALSQWNFMDRPALQSVTVMPLKHTHDHVVRREIAFREGEVLRLSDVRQTRLQLAQVGVFDRVELRPVPESEGRSGIEVNLVERHGFYRGWTEFAAQTAANLLGKKVKLAYYNLFDEGLTVGGTYRWHPHRPLKSGFLDLPRPLGIPGYLHLEGFKLDQDYELGGTLRLHSKGADFAFSHVIGGRTLAHVGFKAHDRSFDRVSADTPGGKMNGFSAGFDHRLLDAQRHRVDVVAYGFQTAVGSDVSFRSGLASIKHQVFLAPQKHVPFERTVLATRLLFGAGSNGMPLDEMFAPGGSNREMAYPLRGHSQTKNGVLGTDTPIGRSLMLANVELRQRVIQREAWQLGFAVFYDGARITSTAFRGPDQTFHDVGAGLRLKIPSVPLLRLDFGHSLTDGKNAVFVGLNQVF